MSGDRHTRERVKSNDVCLLFRLSSPHNTQGCVLLQNRVFIMKGDGPTSGALEIRRRGKGKGLSYFITK